jgi:isopentenyl diphosphate isomerase/L-lactate dehydrogenase-like FMN-dependent dehydrogenase
VLLGRPYIWALGLGGTEAVTQLLRGFLADIDLTLALSGFTSFDEDLRSAITPST